MVPRSLRQVGLVAAMGLALSACASSGAAPAEGGPAAAPVAPGSVQIIVVNTAFGAEDATILLTGALPQSLGSVRAGQTATFTVEITPNSYGLSARTVQGASNSPSFSLFANTIRVTWDMNTNRITQASR
jgi:hypothetical protein